MHYYSKLNLLFNITNSFSSLSMTFTVDIIFLKFLIKFLISEESIDFTITCFSFLFLSIILYTKIRE